MISCMILAQSLAWGQSKLSPSMSLYLDTTAVKADIRPHKTLPAKPTGAEIIQVFLTLEGDDCRDQLEAAGAEIGTIAGNLATARIPASKVGDIAALGCVSYIEKAAPVSPRLDLARPAIAADCLTNGEALPSAYRGAGVVIGLIDNGFEYGHPNFYDEEKTHLRIKRVWDQNREGTPPSSFSYGTEYDTEEEILAAAYDSNTTTHGTHVLGIAAGADHTGHDYTGIAPDADLVLVSLNSEEMVYGDNTTVVDGIKYIFDYAESVGKPCVINLSLGSHIGPHDGTSAFDRMTDQLQGPGRLLVGSVGNEGGHKFHAAAHFDGGTTPQKVGTFIDFKYIYSEYSMVEMWGDAGMKYQFLPFVYDLAGEKVAKIYDPITIGATSQETGEYTFNNANDGITGSIRLLSEINPANKKGHAIAVFNFFSSDKYRIGFYVSSDQAGTVHMWTDDYYSGLSNFGCEGFINGDDNCSAGEIGGTGKRIISVGAYVTRDHFTRFGIYYPSGEEEGHIASFSSHGPTADGRIKPDVSAPGSYIVSSMSSAYTGEIAKAANVTWNGVKYPFGFMQGSSMAAPMVSGALACWLQARPDLSPEQALDAIRHTASTDKITGNIETDGDNVWGHGKFDAWNGLKYVLSQDGVSLPGQENRRPEVRVLPDGQIVLLATSESHSATVKIYSMTGAEVFSRQLGHLDAGSEHIICTGGIPTGIYLLRFTDATANTFAIKILIK